MQLIYTERKESLPVVSFQKFGIAVIKQYADDDCAITRKQKNICSNKEKKTLEKKMESIKRFFLSKWYELFIDYDNGIGIVSRLIEEVYRW